MLLYLVKRMLAMIPTLLGITFLTFLIITCAPGDPVSMQMAAGGKEGSESQVKKGDAIRAKKKLLGMMESEEGLRAWTTERRDPERRADGTSVGPRPLERRSLGDLGSWARSLAVDAARGRAFVGTQDGRVHQVALADGTERPLDTEPFTRSAAGGRTEPCAVWAVAVSPDGERVAAADSTGRVRVLSAADGKRVAEFAGVGRTVRDLAYLPSGAAFVTACDDGRLRVHDAKTAEVRREIPAHALFVGAVEAAADGRTVYSVGYDRKVRRWDVETGTATEVGEIPAAGNALALSADGAWLAAGGEDRGATVFEVGSGASPAPVAMKITGAHGRAVSALAFTPDRELLVTAAKDGGVGVWRTKDREKLGQAPDNTNGEVFAVGVSPDGATFWTASESDRPRAVWKRYLTWLGKLATLDFDRSFIDGEKVIDKVWEALPVTIGLNVIALLVIYMISVPVGVASAVRRGQPFDRTASLIVFLLWSLPNFWFATLLIQRFSSPTHFDWFPSFGLKSLQYDDLSFLQKIGDRATHLLIPMVVLTYAGFAGLAQYMRTSMLETIAQDYVRTARAKGLSETVVIFKHALRNSLVTMVTLVGTMLPAMIGGSVIAEMIFSIRGMGYLGFTAILERDYPVIMAVTTLSAVLTLIGILVSDVLYAVVDPRISHA